jgi:hypothetical protein
MTFARRLAHVDNIPQRDSASNAFNKLTQATPKRRRAKDDRSARPRRRGWSRREVESGNDRYTTEVVLQRFRGELQLLDEAPKEGGGRPSGDSRRPAFSGGADPLDDDIPF